jgi:hypothetical protein
MTTKKASATATAKAKTRAGWEELYIPTLGAKNAPKMGHPLLGGLVKAKTRAKAGLSAAHSGNFLRAVHPSVETGVAFMILSGVIGNCRTRLPVAL